jgi:hypothetical protein
MVHLYPGLLALRWQIKFLLQKVQNLRQCARRKFLQINTVKLYVLPANILQDYYLSTVRC